MSRLLFCLSLFFSPALWAGEGLFCADALTPDDTYLLEFGQNLPGSEDTDDTDSAIACSHSPAPGGTAPALIPQQRQPNGHTPLSHPIRGPPAHT